MNKIQLVFVTIFLAASCYAQSSHQLKRDADQLYQDENYVDAEISYHKAYNEEKDYKASYNLGNSLFQQERYEEAAGYYESSISLMPDDKRKSKAYHNLGNALLQQQKFDESIAAYKMGIRLNPLDTDIKENLLLAKMAKKQMEEQEQQQEQQQNQEEQNQEQQEQQQNQEEQEQQQQEQQDSTSQEQQQQDSLQQQQAQESELDSTAIDSSQMIPAVKLSKEEAARLLEAAEQEERKVQEKLKRVKSNKTKPTKDW